MAPHSRTVGLFATDISVSHGATAVLVDVSLTLTEASRTAVLGPNGVGKSTLLRALAGEISPDVGTITTAPPTASVGLLSQELDRQAAPTVQALVAARTGAEEATAALDAATEALAAGTDGAADEYDRALTRWLDLGAADLDVRLAEVAADLGLHERLLEADPRTLSGGEAARVGLAIIVLSRFDLTLLDEPTNDLDTAGLATLDEWVTSSAGGLLIVSHDRAFLERHVTEVIEIDGHHRTATRFGGGWAAFMTERDRQRDIAVRDHADYVTERDRLKRRSQTQREWATKGASRAKKNPSDGDKHIKAFNVDQTEKLAGKAKSTLRQAERLEVVEKPFEGWELRFSIAEAPRSGLRVVTAQDAVCDLGDFVLGPISFEVAFGERVRLAGPNGSGKSTLIEAILGRIEPTSGSVELGSSVVVGELGQRRGGFDDGEASVAQVFQDRSGLVTSECRSVLAKFGLDAGAAGRPASSLSAGERTRAQLALFEAIGVNLLVLDEPTNHLDLEAIIELESALETYSGTLLLVSHDVRMVENVAIDHVIDLGLKTQGP